MTEKLAHIKELTAKRDELDRRIELGKQKANDFLIRFDELPDDHVKSVISALEVADSNANAISDHLWVQAMTMIGLSLRQILDVWNRKDQLAFEDRDRLNRMPADQGE
jgi:hypothetical protein